MAGEKVYGMACRGGCFKWGTDGAWWTIRFDNPYYLSAVVGLRLIRTR